MRAHRIRADADRAFKFGAEALQGGRHFCLIIRGEPQSHAAEGLQMACGRCQVLLDGLQHHILDESAIAQTS